MIKCISPIDESIYVERHLHSNEEIASAIFKARIAHKKWSQLDLEERIVLLENALEYFKEHREGIAEEITWQMGRPISFSQREVTGLMERAQYMLDKAPECLATISPAKKEGFTRYIKRESLGVIVVLAPWNYPYLTSVNSIIPALAAGNTVILKHSSQTPLCAERYFEAFKKAGLPEGVFQYLHLDHEKTETLVQSKIIRHVAFTGSVEGGTSLEHSLAGSFKGLALELGGKDSAYVHTDAMLEKTVESLVDGAFFNSGQSCCGIERIYVHEELYDEFVHSYVAFVKNYKMGSPIKEETTLGPMVKKAAKKHVIKQIESAVAAGARLLIADEDFPRFSENECYLAPQILVDVDHSMDIMTEETFGPAVGIMKVASAKEALQLMNDSKYGLTASIYSQDIELVEEMGPHLEVGTVFMNRCDYLDPALSWSGLKNSGRGYALSTLGYENLTQPKSFHFKEI